MFTCHLQIRGAAGGVDREIDVGKLLIAGVENRQNDNIMSVK